VEESCDNSNASPENNLPSPNAAAIDARQAAARRLIESSVMGYLSSSANEDESSNNDNDEALLADLKLVLGDTFEETEIIAMIEKARQSAKTAITPNSDDHTNMYSADRHATAILDTFQNYDCMQREFDVLDPAFDTEEATRVLEQ
ncbi:MAG: hypothetical protein SGARI_007925, partial [Bacillariaceae sp.]